MKNIKMVVFDMAGTTIDENNVVYKTLHKAINKIGVNVSIETVLEHGAGKEKFKAIKDILQTIKIDPPVDANMIFDDFKIMLNNKYAVLKVKPINGVEALLLKLRQDNIKVVLNTGYSSKIANLLLDKLNWVKEIHYDALITADDVVNGRPHPDMIFKAMKLMKIKDASTVLKAGDSAIDIIEGKNANCGITVGVLSGAQTKAQIEMEQPTYILDSLASLNKVIK